MNWIIYLFTAIAFFGLSDLFIKLSSGKIHDAFGGFLLNLSSVFPLILFLIFYSLEDQKIFEFKPYRIIFSAIAGFLIGTGTIFIFKNVLL